ncbi:hypothetical protein [Mycolicibacter senuensis]|uniref:hypothetical protein n=1 Tax=Mycolicibacter senuensis TaxID=386913 RepID=UPI001401F2A9|nr:hypothetical protein [Mycolicibacter senuensis]
MTKRPAPTGDGKSTSAARAGEQPRQEPNLMTAEKGWIGEPQPPKQWHESRASAARRWVQDEQRRRQKRGDYSPVTVEW